MTNVWWNKQSAKNAKIGAEARGRWAEKCAADYLKSRGFTELTRRAKTPVGEIDLIVSQGTLLAFIEVKYRQDEEDALWSISWQQQKRIVRAAEVWLAAQPLLSTLDMRFDAIFVNAAGVVRHIEDAFRPES